MLTDRDIIINLAVTHVEGEGDWLLNAEHHVGEDDA